MPTIYRKTAKGVAEIETRAHRLPPRLRSALILVDGKRDSDDLRGLLGPQAEETLLALAEQGFVAAVGETVRSAPPAPPPPAPTAPSASSASSTATGAPPPAAAAAAPPVDVESVKRDAVRFLNDQLGPAAEGMALRLEKARTAEELRPLMNASAQLLMSVRGRAAAEAFVQRFDDRL